MERPPKKQQQEEERQEEEKKDSRGWERYFASQFKSASTLRMYTGRVRGYCRWLASQADSIVSSESVSRFLDSLASHEAKLQTVAALTARYNKYEGRNLKFPALKRPRGYKEPIHKALDSDSLQAVFAVAAQDTVLNALVHFLYDAGARIQDAEKLAVAPFATEILAAERQRRAYMSFVLRLPGKKSAPRDVVISPATLQAVSVLLDGR